MGTKEDALLEEMRQSYEMVRFYDNQYFRILAIFTAFYLGSIGYLLNLLRDTNGTDGTSISHSIILIFIFASIFVLIYIIIRNNSIWNLKNWGRINVIRKKLCITSTLPSETLMDKELSKKLDRTNIEKEEKVINFVKRLVEKRGWDGPFPKSGRVWSILVYFLIMTLGVMLIIIDQKLLLIGYVLSIHVIAIPITYRWSNFLHKKIETYRTETEKKVERIWWIPVLAGIYERVIITALIGFNVGFNISGTAGYIGIGAWMVLKSVKSARGWQTWSKGTTYERAVFFIGLIGSIMSIVFAIVGGLIINPSFLSSLL
jgi:hypothetical protein